MLVDRWRVATVSNQTYKVEHTVLARQLSLEVVERFRLHIGWELFEANDILESREHDRR